MEEASTSRALENSTSSSASSQYLTNAEMSDEAPLLSSNADDIKLKQSGGKDVNLQQLSAPPGVDLGCIKFTRPVAMTLGTTFIVVVGTALGFAVPSDLKGDVPQWIKYLSGVIGWIYFMAWSVSFYPQFYLNYVRKSVIGMSFDYQMLNLVGFTAYSIFNLSFFYNEDIKQQYFERHGSHNVVQSNDVFFAVHALFWTCMTFGQIFRYEGGGQKHSPFILAVAFGSVGLFSVYAIVLAAGVTGSIFNWLDFVVGVSYVKLGVTLIKYFPQAYLNYQRKSTIGWTVVNVLLDFTGGTLSVVQQLLDCAVTNNWDGIKGDTVKFALGFTSMVFDIVFMVQHYILYADNNKAIEAAAAAEAAGASSGSEVAALLPPSTADDSSSAGRSLSRERMTSVELDHSANRV